MCAYTIPEAGFVLRVACLVRLGIATTVGRDHPSEFISLLLRGVAFPSLYGYNVAHWFPAPSA